MKRTLLIVALLASGFAAAQDGYRPAAAATSAATAVTLPATVVTDRANVSAGHAAVADAKARLVAAVSAGDAAAVQTTVAAYQAARIRLDTDLRALRTDALPIVTQDEANLGDDRILIEVYTLTNNASGLAAARAQLDADRAQAEANRAAIFGNLCPAGVACADGHGPGFGPGFGPPPGFGRDMPMRGR